MSAALSVNIAAPLAALARSQPHTLAIVEPHGDFRAGRVTYRHLTYRELDAETDRLARGLEKIGIRRGTRTVLMVPPRIEFYSLTFALFKVGAVVVLIDPGMGTRNLGICLGEAAPEAFVGVPKAHLRPPAAALGQGQRAHLCHRWASTAVGRAHARTGALGGWRGRADAGPAGR